MVLRLSMIAMACTIAACQGPDKFDLLPPGTFPPGTGVDGNVPDAQPDAMTTTVISGTLCFYADPIDPFDCQAVPANTLTVGLRGRPETTAPAADGSFELDLPIQSSAVVQVYGDSNFRSSLFEVDIQASTGLVIPVISEADFTDFFNTLGVIENANPNHALFHFVENGSPATGVIIDSPVGTLTPTFYDPTAGSIWVASASTGPAGMAATFNVLADQTPETFTLTANAQQTLEPVILEDNFIAYRIITIN